MLLKPLPAAIICALLAAALACPAQTSWQKLVSADSSFSLDVPTNWYLSQTQQQAGALLLYAPEDHPTDTYRESFSVQRQPYSEDQLFSLSNAVADARSQNPALASFPDTWIVTHLLAQNFESQELLKLPGVRFLKKERIFRSGQLMQGYTLTYQEEGQLLQVTYAVVFYRQAFFVFSSASAAEAAQNYDPAFQRMWESLRLQP